LHYNEVQTVGTQVPPVVDDAVKPVVPSTKEDLDDLIQLTDELAVFDESSAAGFQEERQRQDRQQEQRPRHASSCSDISSEGNGGLPVLEYY
jgi:hypothetical protein